MSLNTNSRFITLFFLEPHGNKKKSHLLLPITDLTSDVSLEYRVGNTACK